MSQRLGRSLVLVCSLILALPPGWCCMAATAMAPVGTPEFACRGCCCCPDAPKNTPETPSPAPVSPFKDCCCADRNTTTPSGPSKVALDLSLPTLLAPVDAGASTAGHSAETLIAVHFADPPPHLLYCVWLC